MDVKKRDRCGSIFDQSLHVKDKISVTEELIFNTKKSEAIDSYEIIEGSVVKNYDLCRKCMGEFMTWFAEPEESVEHGKEIPDVYK